MPEQRKVSIWYVLHGPDIQNKRGPFNLQQLQELLKDGEVLGSDRIVNQEGKLTPMTVMDLLKSSSDDPSYRLFEAFQFAKDRTVTKPTEAPAFILEEEETGERGLSWPLILGGLVFLILVGWYWSSSQEPSRSDPSRPKASSSQQSQTSSAPSGSQAVSTSTPTPPPQTPKATSRPTQTPTAKPTPTARPTQSRGKDRESDRDSDKDKDKDRDRGKALGLPLGDDVKESDLSDRDRDELNNLNRIQTEDVTPTSLPSDSSESSQDSDSDRNR